MTITTNDDNDNPLSDKYLHRGYDEPGTILGPSHQLFNLPNDPILQEETEAQRQAK